VSKRTVEPAKSSAPDKFPPALQRELKDLLKKIEKVEAEQQELYALMAEHGFYQKRSQGDIPRQLEAEALSAETRHDVRPLGSLGKVEEEPA